MGKHPPEDTVDFDGLGDYQVMRLFVCRMLFVVSFASTFDFGILVN